MSQLEAILEKLKGDFIFSNDYEITMEKWYNNDIICVKRPGKSAEEKVIYDPHIGMNYNQTFCFMIDISTTLFLFNTLQIVPVSYNPERIINTDNDRSEAEEYIGWSIDETPYTQTITFHDVNISAMKKYIVNTELSIIRKRTNEKSYLASNEYLCSKCKCKIGVM